jgi:hypothetical protein
MADITSTTKRRRFEVLEGMLPIKTTQVPSEIIAGLTLAALAIPDCPVEKNRAKGSIRDQVVFLPPPAAVR